MPTPKHLLPGKQPVIQHHTGAERHRGRRCAASLVHARRQCAGIKSPTPHPCLLLGDRTALPAVLEGAYVGLDAVKMPPGACWSRRHTGRGLELMRDTPRNRTKINICRRPRVVPMQAVTSAPPSDVTTSPPPRVGTAHLVARSCGRHQRLDSSRRHIPPSMQIRPSQGILPAANARTLAGRAALRPALRRRTRATPRYAITAPCPGQGIERGRTGA